MTKTLRTHRSFSRTVTPFGCLPDGRGLAAGALAAGIALSGAVSATASPVAEDAAPLAEAALPAAAPVSLPTVTVPAPTAEGESTTLSTVSFTAIEVEVGPTAEELAAEAAEEEAARAAEAAEDQAAEEQAAEAQAAPEEQATEAQAAPEEQPATEAQPAAADSGSAAAEDSTEESSPAPSEEKEEKAAEAPAAERSTSGILGTARAHTGTPYEFGGASPSGWDCSGFTQWVYGQHGISLPHSASAQGAGGTKISKSEAQPGDLVVSSSGGHVGIYAGGNQFVDAGNSRVDTSERKIYSGSWYYVTYRY